MTPKFDGSFNCNDLDRRALGTASRLGYLLVDGESVDSSTVSICIWRHEPIYADNFSQYLPPKKTDYGSQGLV